MGAIRVRHNYANVVLNSKGMISGSKGVGGEIPALLKNGNFGYAKFGGMLNNIERLRCKVSAYSQIM